MPIGPVNRWVMRGRGWQGLVTVVVKARRKETQKDPYSDVGMAFHFPFSSGRSARRLTPKRAAASGDMLETELKETPSLLRIAINMHLAFLTMITMLFLTSSVLPGFLGVSRVRVDSLVVRKRQPVKCRYRRSSSCNRVNRQSTRHARRSPLSSCLFCFGGRVAAVPDQSIDTCPWPFRQCSPCPWGSSSPMLFPFLFGSDRARDDLQHLGSRKIHMTLW
jgi:hypothetical protein